MADPLDGITLLLELLRIIQMNQANNNNVTGSSNTIGKIPPSVQKRALLDELSCLQCILCCCNRYSEAIRKLPASSTGLYTLAVCIMSNVNKSRIIALQVRRSRKLNVVTVEDMFRGKVAPYFNYLACFRVSYCYAWNAYKENAACCIIS